MGHSGSGRSPQPLRHEVGGLHISGIWSHHKLSVDLWDLFLLKLC